ncbi:hypothetical protein F5Y07DRAFT_229569 [Xylaria sp. FL0933]|nr:hypothetical protein F5Y07DRAFT_229569 [Xylaria sp. FL0933]
MEVHARIVLWIVSGRLVTVWSRKLDTYPIEHYFLSHSLCVFTPVLSFVYGIAIRYLVLFVGCNIWVLEARSNARSDESCDALLKTGVAGWDLNSMRKTGALYCVMWYYT